MLLPALRKIANKKTILVLAVFDTLSIGFVSLVGFCLLRKHHAPFVCRGFLGIESSRLAHPIIHASIHIQLHLLALACYLL